MLITIFLLTIISAIISYTLVPFTIIQAKRFKLVDNPKIRPHPAHTHQGIIPRAGGFPIYLGIILPAVFFLSLNKKLIGILLGATLLVMVGLWDDRRDRSPYIRFFLNALAALSVVAAGIGIPYITNPFGGVIPLDGLHLTFNFFGTHSILVWADILAFSLIIWTTNIIGWSGGVDGQLPGFVAISSSVIGLLSLRFASSDPNQLYVSILSFLTAGAFLGFLPWNFYPQKIMPGYGGKTLAGFMLGVLSILSFSKLGTALLVLAVPMTDASFMLIKRLLSGKSPVWATSGHLHHHLLSLGWGRRRIAIFYWLISAFAGIVALSLNSRQKLFAIASILITVSMFIIGINYLQKLTKRKESEEF